MAQELPVTKGKHLPTSIAFLQNLLPDAEKYRAYDLEIYMLIDIHNRPKISFFFLLGFRMHKKVNFHFHLSYSTRQDMILGIGRL